MQDRVQAVPHIGDSYRMQDLDYLRSSTEFLAEVIAEASQLASPMLTVRMRATGMQEGLSCQKDPEQLSLLMKGALAKDGRCTVSPR